MGDQIGQGTEPQLASETEPPLAALLVEFGTTAGLIQAADQIRAAGYKKWDAYTPFPVHGLDHAMGVSSTKLPWVVFLCGLAGAVTGLGMQWWMNASNPQDWLFVPNFLQGYQFLISGKPAFSLPANIPVMFELTVLFSAVGAFIGMLTLNQLPTLYNPLFSSTRFKKATDDKFLLAIHADDPLFDPIQTAALLNKLGGSPAERIYAEPTRALPRVVKPTLVIVALLALVPVAVVTRARAEHSPYTRIRIIQDMGVQPKYLPQAVNPVFADFRADRLPVEGTVSTGALPSDEHFYRGLVNGKWAETFPPAALQRPGGATALLQRGQERFIIYCSACHGLSGYGNGPVTQRAIALQESAWVKSPSFHEDLYRQMPVGQIFNTITHGIRTMAPYGPQVPPEDHWAIIAYLRTLQLSQHAGTDLVPPEEFDNLKDEPVTTQTTQPNGK